jgi:hypothetical protein
MFPKERKEFFKEFQIFFPGKSGDALLGIVGFLLFEIRGIKEDQVGLVFSLDRPQQAFRVPLVRLDLRPCFRSIGQIKRPAFSVECKAGIRNNATTSHGIENKVSLLCKVKEGMADQLCRNLPGPAISKTWI